MVVSIEDVAAHLQHDWGSLAEQAADQIYAELASYDNVPRDGLLRSVRMNLERGVATLMEGAAPTHTQAAENRETTRQRIDEGVPVEDIIRAYRLSLKEIHARLIELSGEMNLPSQETLRGANLLWELGDWFVAGAAVEYRYRAGDEAVRRSLAHSELVREVLSGSDDFSATLVRLEDYGLDTGVPHSVVIAHPPTPPGGTLTSEHGFRIYSAKPALVAQVGRRIVGLIPESAEIEADTSPVAVGSSEPILRIERSAALAERVWLQAQSSPPGVFRMEHFGWRLAVPVEPDIGRLLIEKYLSDISPDTVSGREVVKTLRAMLAEQMNIRKAALALRIHQNTLRYRLERYSEATRVDLSSTDAQIELAWALEALAQRQSGHELGEFYEPSRRSSGTPL